MKKRMRNIVFVGGVHGVGKTTLCRQLCSELDMKYVTASELIKRVSEQSENTKRVKNISRNQDILLRAIDEELSQNEQYFLDGHFCLLNSAGSAEKVPLLTFQGIAPRAVLLLHDDPRLICERLHSRDGLIYKEEELEKFQNQEIENARYVCKELKIPFLMLRPNQEKNEAVEFIKAVF